HSHTGSVLLNLDNSYHVAIWKLALHEFAGVATSAVRDFCAGEHTSDFFNSSTTVELVHAHLGATSSYCLLDQQVSVSKTRNLRLVSHAQNLFRFHKSLKLSPDSFTPPPANAAVYLIEHNCPRKFQGVGNSLQHQHQS